MRELARRGAGEGRRGVVQHTAQREEKMVWDDGFWFTPAGVQLKEGREASLPWKHVWLRIGARVRAWGWSGWDQRGWGRRWGEGNKEGPGKLGASHLDRLSTLPGRRPLRSAGVCHRHAGLMESKGPESLAQRLKLPKVPLTAAAGAAAAISACKGDGKQRDAYDGEHCKHDPNREIGLSAASTGGAPPGAWWYRRRRRGGRKRRRRHHACVA